MREGINCYSVNGRIVDGKCYIFMKEKKNYDDANQFCKNEGTRLFEPRSKTINKLVFDKTLILVTFPDPPT